MKRIKALLLSACITAPAILNAGVISDYTLDTNTNIVTDTANNLEWLQWSVTVGMSINDALSTYLGDGWGLASNLQMAELFMSYYYNAERPLFFDGDETVSQRYSTGSDGAIENVDDIELLFVSMFGNTDSDPLKQRSSAYYGSDLNSDGLYNRATIYDDNVEGGPSGTLYREGFARLSRASVSRDKVSSNTGIALVRDARTVAVREPSTLALFCLGLFGLGAARRTKKS